MEHQISNSGYDSFVVYDIGPRQEMKKGRLIPGHRKVLIGKWRSELEVFYQDRDPDRDWKGTAECSLKAGGNCP